MALLAGLWVGVAGCGLPSLDDIPGVSFQLPTRTYKVEMAGVGGGANVPAVACNQPADCCVGGACAGVTCDGGQCALVTTVELAEVVDLAKEVPQLASMDKSVLMTVNLRTIDVTVANKTTVDVPSIDLYVAPSTTKSAGGPGAQKLATVPARAAGTTKRDILEVGASASAAFASFAMKYGTPFNIIAATRVLVKGGTPPSGRLELTVTGTAEARF